MPEFTYRDRLAIAAEQSLWTVVAILTEEHKAIGDTAFGESLSDVAESAKKLAGELRDYNDQFEVAE